MGQVSLRGICKSYGDVDVTELFNAKVGPERNQCDSGAVVGLMPDAAGALTFGADGRLVL